MFTVLRCSKVAAVLVTGLLILEWARADEAADARVTIHPLSFNVPALPPEGQLEMRFHFVATRPMRDANLVFVHIQNAAGKMVGQADHAPTPATNAAVFQGEVKYTRYYTVPADFPDGDYTVYAGLYRADGRGGFINEPLTPASGVTGEADRRYRVGTFRVDRRAAKPPEFTDRQPTLDLSGYKLVFEDKFDKMSIGVGEADKTWKTDYAGYFGEAQFVQPDELVPGHPFTIQRETSDPGITPGQTEGGVLRIEMRRDKAFVEKDRWRAHRKVDAELLKRGETLDREWAGALMRTTNETNEGFALQYGYFEARLKFPDSPTVWSAFWLVSVDSPESKAAGRKGAVEIDVVEFYGAQRSEYQPTVHVWLPGPHRGESFTVPTKAGAPVTGFHNYGVMVTKEAMTFYFDGVEVWKTPTPAEHDRPLNIILNHGAGFGPLDKLKTPNSMYVDRVRAYAPKEAT